MRDSSLTLPLRRVATCLDYLRVPLNAEERFHRPGDIPYWGANTVQGYVDEALVKESVVLLGEDGAPFFDRDRPVAFYSTEPIWPNNHIHVLKPRLGFDGRWLAYALNDVDYSLYIDGSTRDKLTQGSMMGISLRVPEGHAQSAIADYLDRETAQIDALIEKQKLLISSLGERRTQTVQRQFDGIHPKSMTRLKRLATVQTGVTLGGVQANHSGVEVPYLRVANVQVGHVDLGEVKEVQVPTEELKNYLLRPGDVLMTEGGDIDKLGRGCIWRGEIELCIHQNHIFAVRCSTQLDSEFLVYYLDSAPARLYFRQTARKTTNLASTNKWTLGNLPIPAPELRVQTGLVSAVCTAVAEIDNLTLKARSLIALSQERRSALITAAVTGQIDVGNL